jgi:MFS family permease
MTKTPPLHLRVAERKAWFLILIAGVSKLGDQLLYLAIPVLLLQNAGSMSLAVLAIAARATPYIISPILGLIIDRYNLRSVYIIAQLIQAVTIGLIPLFIGNNAMILLLLCLSGVGGVLASLLNLYKIIPQIAPEDKLEYFIGRFSGVTDVARVLGPYVGGLAVLAFGAKLAVLIDAATFAVEAIFIGLLVKSTRPVQAAQNFVAMLKQGFKHFVRSADLKALAGTMALSNLGIGVIETLMLASLIGIWGVPLQGATIIMSLGALAGLVGSVVTVKVFAQAPTTQRILFWQCVTVLGAVAINVPSTWVRSLGYALIVGATSASNVITIAYRRSTIPEALQGRVNANIRMIISGAIPLSGVVHAHYTKTPLSDWPMLLVLVFTVLSAAVWAIYVIQAVRTQQTQLR